LIYIAITFKTIFLTNHWTECIDIWQIAYLRQGNLTLVEMKPWGHK